MKRKDSLGHKRHGLAFILVRLKDNMYHMIPQNTDFFEFNDVSVQVHLRHPFTKIDLTKFSNLVNEIKALQRHAK